MRKPRKFTYARMIRENPKFYSKIVNAGNKQRTFILWEVLDYQLQLAKVSWALVSKKNWFQKATLTPDQHKAWMEHAVNVMRKRARWSKKMAEREAQWSNLMWGFPVKERKSKRTSRRSASSTSRTSCSRGRGRTFGA